MKNFIQEGNVVTLTAPTGGVSSGAFLKVGDLFGVVAFNAAEGDEVEVATSGVFELAKAAVAFTEGAKAYWDSAAGNVTTTATSNTLIGHATKAAASGDALVRVRLSI